MTEARWPANFSNTRVWYVMNTNGSDPGLLDIQVDAEFTFKGWPQKCQHCQDLAFIKVDAWYFCPAHCPRLNKQDYVIV